jgi:hypothetical protein
MPLRQLTRPGLALTIVFAVLVAACGRTASPWEDGITTEYGCDNGSTLVVERGNDLFRWKIDNENWVGLPEKNLDDLIRARDQAFEACPGAVQTAIEEPVPGLDLFELPEPD